MKFVNENPSGKKPYWAFGYPYAVCANCGYFIPTYSVHENGKCSLSFDGYDYQTFYEGDKACKKYTQNKARLQKLIQ